MPRTLTYYCQPLLTEAKLNANVCDGFGLTQYKLMPNGREDPVQCPVPEAVSLSDKGVTVPVPCGPA